MNEPAALSPLLHAAMEKGETIVTGNERAARTLRQRFDHLNQALGLTSWQPPSVLSWDAWMASLWRDLLLSGNTTEILLNRTQEHDLWLSVLRRDSNLDTLRSFDSLADLASDALGLTCSFNAEEDLQRTAGSSDARAFRRWLADFNRLCRSIDSFPIARLEEKLTTAIRAGHLPTPSTIHLLGFLSITPQQKLLMEAARHAGTSFITEPQSPASNGPILLAARDHRDEVLCAARWAKHLLETQPDAQIAIVAPALETQRWLIEHTFGRVLVPANAAPLFEFSLGFPLSQAPRLAAALDLLRWAAEPLPLANATALLLSRHFADDAGERGHRAEFDAGCLRRAHRLRPELTLVELQTLLVSNPKKYPLSRLKACLSAMRRLQAAYIETGLKRTHEDWATLFREYLQAAGWSTPERETSLEFQLRRKWESALDELSTLDFRGARSTYLEALSQLTRIANETTFAPKTRQAPIQILGTLESAGCTFDALWFLGATDLAWPPAATANPLLPRLLQQSLGMPGADRPTDLAFARAATSSIVASATQIIFSYAREAAEGTQRPSALVQELASAEISVNDLLPQELPRTPLPLDRFADVTPIPPPANPRLPGGARVLELQAACGFRAFAELRLGSVELRGVRLGMGAGERGTLVHESLEQFWIHTRTQAALRAMSSAERDALLQEAIGVSLREARQQSSASWDFAYIELQRERLTSLLNDWLDFELTRAPFQVLEHEKTRLAPCGPLLLKTRIDRVDQIGDRSVLMDYKTGVANRAGWDGTRPDAPQLPLYAITSPIENLGGLLYAHVRSAERKKPHITGKADSEAILSARMQVSPEEFQEQLAIWHSVLTTLAEAFYSGDVDTQPKLFPKTCTHCGQRILCRIDPLTMEEEDDVADVEGSHDEAG